MKLRNIYAGAVSALVVVGLLVAAFAQDAGTAPAYDLDPLVKSVDFSQVVTAVLGIAASLMAVYVVMRGIRFIYSAVRG